MRTKIAFFSLVFLMIVFASCKKPNHYVRVTSDYADTVLTFTVGPDNYGTIGPGETTPYQHMPEGTWNIYGVDADTRATASGTVSVEGHGTHYWTVVISNTGNFSLLPD